MTDAKAEIVAAFSEMDDETRRIFLAGIVALKAGRLTVDTFEGRVTPLVLRHRAGQPVTADDLKFL